MAPPYSAYIVELTGLVANNAGDRRALALVTTTPDGVRRFLEQLIGSVAPAQGGDVDLGAELRLSLEADAADEDADDDELFHARLYVVQRGELVSVETLDRFVQMKIGKKSIPLDRRKRVAREVDAIHDTSTTFALDWPKLQPKLVELHAPTLPEGEPLELEPGDDYEGDTFADEIGELRHGLNWGDV